MSRLFSALRNQFAMFMIFFFVFGLALAPVNFSLAQEGAVGDEKAELSQPESSQSEQGYEDEAEGNREPASNKSKADAKSEKVPPNGMKIQILDPRIKTEELERAGYTIQRAEDVEGYKKVPEPNYRDKLLAKVGLTETVASWDHLDRDMLFMRAKNYDMGRLQKFYPKIPSKKLRALKNEIEETGAGK